MFGKRKKWQFVGYKGVVDKSDDSICVIEILYNVGYKDHHSTDHCLVGSEYTLSCKVGKIINLTKGKKQRKVDGRCVKEYTYIHGKKIDGTPIYFFSTLGHDKEWAFANAEGIANIYRGLNRLKDVAEDSTKDLNQRMIAAMIGYAITKAAITLDE